MPAPASPVKRADVPRSRQPTRTTRTQEPAEQYAAPLVLLSDATASALQLAMVIGAERLTVQFVQAFAAVFKFDDVVHFFSRAQAAPRRFADWMPPHEPAAKPLPSIIVAALLGGAAFQHAAKLLITAAGAMLAAIGFAVRQFWTQRIVTRLCWCCWHRSAACCAARRVHAASVRSAVLQNVCLVIQRAEVFQGCAMRLVVQ